MNCPYCDNPLPPQTAQCPHCGAAVTPVSGPSSVSGPKQQLKSPGVALFLSLLIAGSGQMYNGQVAKGLFVLFACFFLWVIDLGFIVNILACIDAYKIAQKINNGRQVSGWEWF